MQVNLFHLILDWKSRQISSYVEIKHPNWMLQMFDNLILPFIDILDLIYLSKSFNLFTNSGSKAAWQQLGWQYTRYKILNKHPGNQEDQWLWWQNKRWPVCVVCLCETYIVTVLTWQNLHRTFNEVPFNNTVLALPMCPQRPYSCEAEIISVWR